MLMVVPYWEYREVGVDYCSQIAGFGRNIVVVVGDPGRATSTEVVNEYLTVHSVHSLNLLKPFGLNYPLLPSLTDAFSSGHWDVVNIQGHLFPSAVQCQWLASREGIPTVVTVHGVLVQRSSFLDLAQKAYLLTMSRHVLGKATGVVCVTRADARMVRRLGVPRKRVAVVPNGVNTDYFAPRREREGVVLWFGRMVAEKGVDYLVLAARRVVEERKDVRFVLVGSGPAAGKIYGLVHRLGLGDSFLFLGERDRKELREIVSKASVVVIPSLTEGLPLALLEAMSCGKPVVASKLAGIEEVVIQRKNGLLVRPRSSMGLADALLELLSDRRLRTALGQEGRRLMVREYDWSVVVPKLHRTIDRFLGQG